MASRFGLRLAARSMRQPALVSPRVGRRMMSSTPAPPSSDTPWIAAAAIGTVGALAFIYSPSGEKAKQHHTEHATTPKKRAAAAKEEAPAESEKQESKTEDSKREDEANAPAVQESIKKSITSDGDSAAAKVEEEKEAKSGSDGDTSVAESVKQSMQFDGDPASAKAAETAEAKATGSPKASDSSESDGDFVKIEKMEVPDVKETLKKADMDVPAIAKADEEKRTKNKE